MIKTQNFNTIYKSNANKEIPAIGGYRHVSGQAKKTTQHKKWH